MAALVRELLRHKCEDNTSFEKADCSDISKDIVFDVWDISESTEFLTTQCVSEMIRSYYSYIRE